MLDPNAGSTLTIEAIHAMVDELIEAHGELIPDGIRAGARATRS
jgi:alpha-galactosidase